MRIIAKRTLKLFWQKHADSESPLKIWYQQVSLAQWKNFNELKSDYGSADAIGNQMVVFNIKGNKYRLIAKVDFKFNLVFIKFIGTHHEYDDLGRIKEL